MQAAGPQGPLPASETVIEGLPRINLSEELLGESYASLAAADDQKKANTKNAPSVKTTLSSILQLFVSLARESQS